MTRLDTALAAIDAANAADPSREDGEPAARLYGARMSAALALLRPDAGEALRIAARGQHIERWVLPRADWPMDKAGYFAWRDAQKARHAARLAEIARAAGYDRETAARIGAIVRKEGLKRDAEAQALEDAACLVFLRYYAGPFAARSAEDKTIDILAKTWRKMSDEGRAAARALDLPPAVRALVEKAAA